MILSMSQVKDIIQCPSRALFKYRDKRVPRRTATPLTLGKLWHGFCESVLKQHNVSQAMVEMEQAAGQCILDLRDDGEDDKANKLATEVGILREAANHWRPDPDVEEILAVEQAMTLPLGSIPGCPDSLTLQFRPDTVVRKFGSLWHEQHRSLGPSIGIPLYLEAAPRDLTERMYHLGLKHNYPGEDVIGTNFDLLRKLKPETIRAKPSAALGRHPVPMDPALCAEAARQVLSVAHVWYLFTHDLLEPWDNAYLDRGSYGNSKDPYLDVLLRKASLGDDDLFMPTEERYDDLEETTL